MVTGQRKQNGHRNEAVDLVKPRWRHLLPTPERKASESDSQPITVAASVAAAGTGAPSGSSEAAVEPPCTNI